MDNYFQNIFPKISGSQEDNQISIFGCPHSFFGHRGHEDTQILLPCIYIILGNYFASKFTKSEFRNERPKKTACFCV